MWPRVGLDMLAVRCAAAAVAAVLILDGAILARCLASLARKRPALWGSSTVALVITFACTFDDGTNFRVEVAQEVGPRGAHVPLACAGADAGLPNAEDCDPTSVLRSPARLFEGMANLLCGVAARSGLTIAV